MTRGRVLPVGTIGRLAGARLALVGLVLGTGAPGASAAAPLPPPELISVDELKDGDINITWRPVSPFVVEPDGGRRALRSDGPFGYRFNVDIAQGGDLVHSETRAPRPPSDFDAGVKTYHPGTRDFLPHGSFAWPADQIERSMSSVRPIGVSCV